MTEYGAALVGLALSIIVVKLGVLLAPHLDVVDHPTGHKTHDTPVPYVGGFGVMAALLCFAVAEALYPATMTSHALAALVLCGLLMFVTGLADDYRGLGHSIRLLVEVIGAAVMILGAGIALSDLGELWPGALVELGILGVPVTVFGMLSVTNALNMVDGVDGLSGSIALVSLILLGALDYLGGDGSHLALILALSGGVFGFLVFNLRCCGRRNAEAFLGDNGSMLIGFMLGWLLIDLSQGEGSPMTPVTALYLFSVPLIDSGVTIARRVWLGRSPFHPDRSHLHHLLLDAGASVQTTVAAITLLHLGIGLMGLVGLYFAVPESALFLAFLGLFALYGHVLARPWRFVPRVRRFLVRIGVTLKHGSGVFVGGVRAGDLDSVLGELSGLLESSASIEVYAEPGPSGMTGNLYLIIDLGSWYEVRANLRRIRRQLSLSYSCAVRQYIERQSGNDSRSHERLLHVDQRQGERRGRRAMYQVRRFRFHPTRRPSGPRGPRGMLVEQTETAA